MLNAGLCCLLGIIGSPAFFFSLYKKRYRRVLDMGTKHRYQIQEPDTGTNTGEYYGCEIFVLCHHYDDCA
jgi:hypothetical protein